MIQRLKDFAAMMPALLILSGFFLMARPVYHMMKSYGSQIRAEHQWKNRSVNKNVRPNDPVAWLKVESIGLETMLLMDATPENLLDMPCVSNRGSVPGQPGLIIVQGHRDSHFRKLQKLSYSDRVELETLAGKTLHYTVQEIEILDPKAMETRFRNPAGQNGMVLITCYPFQYIGSAPKRYVVWLKQELPIAES